MIRHRYLVVLLLPLLLSSSAFAQDAGEKKEEKKKETRLGNIAGSGSTNLTTSSNFVGEDSYGSDQNPITGSASIKQGVCVARIYNNSDERYSVSVKVRGLNKNGKQTDYRTFSVTLGPKGNKEEKAKFGGSTTSCQLDLEGARGLGGKSTPAKPKVEAQAVANTEPPVVDDQ